MATIAVGLPPEELIAPPGPVVTVAVGAVRNGESPRSAGENPEHVRVLAQAPDELPPIVVHRPTMRVIDGRHRLLAARLRNQPRISVRFFDGDEADAFVLAVRANVAHGLPLPLADRKAAAARILASHPHWSDRMIASVTGLSGKTVAAIRRRGGGSGGSAVPGPRRRVGLDGRARPVDIGERRRLAGSLMAGDPSLSLRQVARAAGISPETARSVRAGLRGGVDGPLAAPATGQPPARLPIPGSAAVVQRFRGDPSLRFTETGRTLLRLLDANAASTVEWAAVVDDVPPHFRPTIAKLAMECALFWRTVAEQLGRDLPA